MGLFPKPPAGFFFLYFFEYETIVRSSAWSFGHSDPDPSSVNTFLKGHLQIISVTYINVLDECLLDEVF